MALQRDNNDEIEGITLRELRDADAMHGNRDLEADFRIAMRNRIRELEEKAARERESYIRVVGYVVSFSLGVLATMVAIWIT